MLTAAFSAGTAIAAIASIGDRRWHLRRRRIVREGQLMRARVLLDTWETATARHKQTGLCGMRLWAFTIELAMPTGPQRAALPIYLTAAAARWINGREVPVLGSPDHSDEAVLAV